jgi:hypothetical protein
VSALPRIIGLAGFARSGKDTAADHLVAEYGYVKVSWAGKLREACLALDPIVGALPSGALVRYSAVIDDLGYEGAKSDPLFGDEFRRTLIRLGTEVGRDIFGQDFWVNLLVGSLDPGERYVVPDTRFPNEARAIKAYGPGGRVIRIVRPGVDAVADHPSETALADWPYDAVIRNDADLRLLHWRLNGWLQERAA